MDARQLLGLQAMYQRGLAIVTQTIGEPNKNSIRIKSLGVLMGKGHTTISHTTITTTVKASYMF